MKNCLRKVAKMRLFYFARSNIDKHTFGAGG